MKISDVLLRNPATAPLVNNGQARIADRSDDRVVAELKGELSTFVCEGQYAEGLHRIVSSFLAGQGQTNQKAAWVSGFYGSGKSHLLKMLAHLWQDTAFPDGSTARSLVPAMPQDIRDLLRELDTAGRRGGGLLAAAGSLPSGSTDHVRHTVLSVLLRAVGLPDQYPQALFCLWLKDQGFYEQVVGAVTAANKEWSAALNDLYVSPVIAKAVLACDPRFAPNEADARKTLREQFPRPDRDLTTAQFLEMAKRALKLAGRDGRGPCTLLILDEVQVYIGDSNDRSVMISEVVEAVSKQLDSQVLVVAAGQSALSEVRLLQKMMDRFTIAVPLSDTDVETVTRKVLLQKKPDRIGDVTKKLDDHAGEISRQLQGTRIAERTEDRDVRVSDYPLLPVRRRFWEHCFRQIDAAGTQSQLRSQLRIIHDAVARLSDRPLGAVVPGDELYDALAPGMVISGALLREINERILGLASDRKPDGRLRRRVCGLIFLISRLSREPGADIGVRATKEHLADLLVDDLGADNGTLRNDVERALNALFDDGVLMRLANEYRLQTREGSAWEAEYTKHASRLRGNDTDVQQLRDQFLYAASDRIVRSLRMVQGQGKTARDLIVHRDQIQPPRNPAAVTVWIQDGWSCSQKSVEDNARSAGTDDETVYVYVPRKSAEDLQKMIIEADAAQKTIDARGVQSNDEGREARRSMESRRDMAVENRDRLISDIVAAARVFQGGGSELLAASLADRLKEGVEAGLVRLFPRFKDADAPAQAWKTALDRARAGSDQPFQPLNYNGNTEQHPVCQQVLASIGAGRTGADIRKELKSSPYGWPQDAIDAALIALHRLQTITATLNGVPAVPGQLDQNRISKAEFRKEGITLTVSDRLALRRLFGLAGVTAKPNEESIKATQFLDSVLSLAGSSGGPPPLPAPPSVADIEDLRRLAGNEQLAAIRQSEASIQARLADWKKTSELAAARKPVWDIVERLARQAEALPAAANTLTQVAAVRDRRLLLDSGDPASALRQMLSAALREALNEAAAHHERAYQAGLVMLAGGDAWQQISEADRTSIAAQVGLRAPEKPDAADDVRLLSALESQGLTARRDVADAVAGRVQRALQEAARLLEPKVAVLSVEQATLRSEADVRAWLGRQETVLLAAVSRGPVMVS